MSAPEYARVKEIFMAVAQAAPGERDAILSEHCADNSTLRARVEQLLRADSVNARDGTPFMGGSGWSHVLRELADEATVDQPTVVRVGPYEVVRTIGEGGMSVVYEALQPEPSRRVAVKLLRAPHLSAAVRARLEREAELLARLDHPAITRVYDAGTGDVEYSTGLRVKQRYQVMELIDGAPLTTYVQANDLTTAARLDLMIAICDAVHHAHQQGVIHRDLKPSNILVTPAGQPKVLDFGISRLLDMQATLTSLSHSGHVLGTPAYMSPEQARGDTRVDTRMDVYALGVLLFEVLTNRLPIDVCDVPITEALRRIVHTAPVRLRTLVPNARADLATIVDTALAKSPERRYGAAAALSSDLRRFRNHEPIAARRPTVIYVLWKLAERHRLLATSVAIAILSTVLGTIGIVWFALAAQSLAHESAARARIAQHEAYRSSIVAAAFAIENDNVGAARRILDQTPPALRNWEWDHLIARTDDSHLTIPWQAAALHPLDPQQFVEYTPDNRLLVLPDQDRLRAWNAETGAPVSDGAAGEYVWRVSYANDVLRCDDRLTDRSFQVPMPPGDWRLRTPFFRRYELVLAPLNPQEPPQPPMHMTLSPDGTHFVTVQSPLEPIEIWRAQPLERRATLAALNMRTDVVRFSEDNRRLITGSWDGRVRLWDVATGRLLATSRDHHRDAILHLAIHEPRQLVATASADQTIRIWQLDDLDHVQVLRGHASSVKHVAFDADGTRLVSADKDFIKTWHPAAARNRNVLRGHGGYVYGVAVSPDGRRIASACFDGGVGIWDIDRRTLVKMLGPMPRQAWRVAFSSDGKLLRVEMDDSSTVVIELESSETLFESSLLRFVGSGIVEPQSHEEVWRHWNPIDRTVIIQDVRTGTKSTVPLSSTACDNAEFISPDGQWATWHYQIFDRHTGELALHLASIPAFHPTGRELVVRDAEDRTAIQVWDPQTRQPIARLAGHTQDVLALAYSPDGTRLASGGYDRVVRIWDVESRKEILQLTGHTGYVHALAWSADGTTLVSASGDHTVRVWDTDNSRDRSSSSNP